MVAYLAKLAEHLREPKLEIDAIVEAGNRVVVTGRVNGVLDGEATSYGFAHSWLFSGERAIRFDEYVDVAAALTTAA